MLLLVNLTTISRKRKAILFNRIQLRSTAAAHNATNPFSYIIKRTLCTVVCHFISLLNVRHVGAQRVPAPSLVAAGSLPAFPSV